MGGDRHAMLAQSHLGRFAWPSHVVGQKHGMGASLRAPRQRRALFGRQGLVGLPLALAFGGRKLARLLKAQTHLAPLSHRK